MKAGGAGVLGFLAGVAITALIANLLVERAASTTSSGEKAATETRRTGDALELSRNGEPAAAARPIEVPIESRAPTAPQPAADARIGMLVYGTVSDPDGAPVKAQWMSLQFTPEGKARRNIEISAEGTYAVTGLPAGKCRVSADLLGYRPWKTELELRADHPTVRLDVVLEPADVLIIKAFTRDGRPLLDALKAELPEKAMWSLRVSALASLEALTTLPQQEGRGWERFEIGSYRDIYEAVGPLRNRDNSLPPDAMGLLELDVPPPVWVTLAVRTAILASQRVEPGTKEVVFTVDVGDVTSTFGSLVTRFVEATTRTPLAGVDVEITDVQGGAPSQKTGADGVLRAEGLRPGGLRFQASLDGYEALNALVTIPPSGHVDLGDIALAKARTLTATVLDDQDHPLSVYVSLQNLDPPPGLTWDEGYQSWMSKRDGSLEMKGLGQHHYSVLIGDKTWTNQPLLVDMTMGDVSGVVLRAVRGIDVNVRLEWPESVTHGLRVTAEQGRVLTDWDSWPGGQTWTAHLAPGRYLAEVRDGTAVLVSQFFDVSAAPVGFSLAP